jgi:hypothetical protein
MSLVELVNNNRTNKNLFYSFLSLYDNFFYEKQETATDILEIGVGGFNIYDKNIQWGGGGGVLLWREYFEKAKIHGIDLLDEEYISSVVKNDDRIILYPSTDGYDKEKFTENFLNKNIKFDIVIADARHSLSSMVAFIKLYSQILKDDGILIIENVQHNSWFDVLFYETPDNLKKFIKFYDLTPHKRTFDNKVFIIKKNAEQQSLTPLSPVSPLSIAQQVIEA